MQLQVAIDRLTLDNAVAQAKKLDGHADIIEMGTSLVKDYGFAGMQAMRAAVVQSQLLVDLKTIDEGAYEFQQGFKAGADILTVMGASSWATIETVAKTTAAAGGTMMIDLLEVPQVKLKIITDVKRAIYALHHSKDRHDKLDPTATVAEFHHNFPQVQHIAIAGGVDLAGAKALAAQGLTDIVIVGGTIMNASDPVAATEEFMEAIR